MDVQREFDLAMRRVEGNINAGYRRAVDRINRRTPTEGVAITVDHLRSFSEALGRAAAALVGISERTRTERETT